MKRRKPKQSDFKTKEEYMAYLFKHDRELYIKLVMEAINNAL